MVEFDKDTDIYGVATQGRPDEDGDIQDDHITEYCIVYNDGTGYKTTKDGGESWDYPYDITNPDDCYKFDGDELASEETHMFDEPIKNARMIKLVVVDIFDSSAASNLSASTQLGLFTKQKVCYGGY